MRHLSAVLALALTVGIACGVATAPLPRLVVLIVLSGPWAVALLAYRRGHVRVQLAASCVLVAAAGWTLAAQTADRALRSPLRAAVEPQIGQEPVVVEGRLREDAALSDGGVVLRVDVQRVNLGSGMRPAAGGISVGVGGTPLSSHTISWTAGRVIRAPAMLRRPARYLNEGLPDQERALARRGVALVGTIKSAALVDVLERGRWWEEAAARVRGRTREALARHVAPRSATAAAVAAAILIGDRAGLAPDLERRLQESGTYHVIAISGGNIAILAGALLLTFGVLGIRGRFAAGAVICALAAYALVAAGGASVLRAVLMAVIYLAVRLIDHRAAAANAVSLTGAVILLFDPLAVTDVGFWLTFGATGALLIAASIRIGASRDPPSRAAGVSRVGIAWRGLTRAALATISVELALAPVAALEFERVTLAGLPLNFAALPAMTIVQIAGMGVVAFDAIGIDAAATLFARAVHVGTVVLTDSTRLLDVAPWLTWRVPPPHVAVFIAYYVALVAAIRACVRRWPIAARRTCIGVAGVLFLWVIAAPTAHALARGDGRLHLLMFDVGQGDAMLVVFPNGRTLALDTGGGTPRGAFDIGDRVIGPALRARSLIRLDYLAVTHGNPDHIGGARALLRDFAPREIWWGVSVAGHEPARALRADAEQRRIPWRTLLRGDRLEVGSVELRVHHPPPPDWERQRVRNDDSLVLELRHGDVSMLLTGDIGRAIEQQLVPLLDPLPLVVLKVPHHGSATSSSREFLDALHPAVALIGVGRGNMYGHPVPAVVDRLYDAGAQVFRTDLDGQIEVISDGTRVWVETFTGRRFTIRSPQ